MQLRATRLIACGRGRSAWTPAQIPTALWLDANDTSTITLNGSTVSQWNDKSGNGRNAVQATAANQPGWGVGRNLLQWSEGLEQGAWPRFQVGVTANAATAPNGTLTADKVTGSAAAGSHVLYQIASIAAAAPHTFVVRAKAAEYQYVTLVGSVEISGGSPVRYSATVDLTTGVITKTASVGSPISPTSSTKALPDGWWEISLSLSSASANVVIHGICPTPTATPTQDGYLNVQYTGDGTSGVLAWGAQVNPGTTADPYQQTTSAAQTLSTGLNGKATMAWPDALNNRFMETSASFATQDVFVVARYRDGTQSSFLAAYQGVFGGAGTGTYIGLIGDTPDKWYTLCDFGQLRRNGGAAQTVSTGVTALPLPPALLNSNRPAGALTASFCVGNDRNLALNRGWSGIMGEIIVLSSIASTETRQRIEGYLAWKWGGF